MHKAIIAKIDKIIEIPGADNIQIAKVLGEDVIVSKDMVEGFVGIFFPVDLQLSEDYCRENNLFRDSTKNKDLTKKGFFDDNRRVRAQPFLKVKSCGYFAPITSLDYTGFKYVQGVGDSFDEINGHKICEKYVSKAAKEKIANKSQKLRKVKEAPFFAKHVDSEQFKHYADRIPTGALLSFHSKKHGTSFRVAKTLVVRPLTLWQKIRNVIVYYTPLTPNNGKMEYVVGTRNVVLDTPEKEGFHGSEAYRFEVMEALKPYLENGMTIYGEIVGFVNGRNIMPSHGIDALKDKAYTKKYGKQITYTYGCKEHEYKFHVYRITRQTISGDLVDMSQKQMEKWCEDRNIPYTLEVHPQMVYNGNVEELRTLVDSLTERPEVLTEDYTDPTHISEGIIIRVDIDGDTPIFYKSKSYAFRVLEGHESIIDEETIS